VKLLGWEGLLPPYGSAKWPDYCSYLEEYYKHNAYDFVADAASNLNHVGSQIATAADMGAAVAKFVSNPLASLLNHRLSN
jgi:hypothetical protein